MEIKELLRDIKLNKYESRAYELILKKGISEASTISKEGNIPFGKIYESLESLFSKELIEIQDTRPKKYKIKNPKSAFQTILNKKTRKSEEELKNLKNTLIQLEEKINKINIPEIQEKTFWVTTIGNKIEDMMKGTFSEAKKEIYMIPYIIDKDYQTKSLLLNIPKFIKEINKVEKRNLKIKAIFPEQFAKTQMKVFKKMKVFEKIIGKVEIRILKNLSPEPFTIIDAEKVILRVNDPINKDKILAMIKILDKNLAGNLKTKFKKMWEISKPIN